jgi:hypothetical protein
MNRLASFAVPAQGNLTLSAFETFYIPLRDTDLTGLEAMGLFTRLLGGLTCRGRAAGFACDNTFFRERIYEKRKGI